MAVFLCSSITGEHEMILRVTPPLTSTKAPENHDIAQDLCSLGIECSASVEFCHREWSAGAPHTILALVIDKEACQSPA